LASIEIECPDTAQCTVRSDRASPQSRETREIESSDARGSCTRLHTEIREPAYSHLSGLSCSCTRRSWEHVTAQTGVRPGGQAVTLVVGLDEALESAETRHTADTETNKRKYRYVTRSPQSPHT